MGLGFVGWSLRELVKIIEGRGPIGMEIVSVHRISLGDLSSGTNRLRVREV